MTRRELLVLVAAVMAFARPLQAQQKAIPVIGFLASGAPNAVVLAAFRQGLSEAGYVDGQNLAIEYRSVENSYDRLPALAADLVTRKVDLIVTIAVAPSVAAKNATSTIPIVFIGVSDPVGLGLVDSLARPDANVTGFSNIVSQLTPKRLELLSELVPQAKVIALLENPNNPTTAREPLIADMQEAARARGVQLAILKAGTESEIDSAFATPRRAACRRARRRRRSVFQHPARAVRGADITSCRSGDLLVARVRRCRRPDQLWNKPCPSLSRGRQLRGENPQRRHAGRSAGPATDNIRAGRQPKDRRGAWPHRAAVNPRPRH